MVTWREGSADRLSSRFACVRVRVGYNKLIPEKLPPEWLVIDSPEGEAEPTKYWLATPPDNVSFTRLVDLAKLRWRIERDYQELKQEVGLGHYEGRGWRGFHHNQPLSIAAYGSRRRSSSCTNLSIDRSKWLAGMYLGRKDVAAIMCATPETSRPGGTA